MAENHEDETWILVPETDKAQVNKHHEIALGKIRTRLGRAIQQVGKDKKAARVVDWGPEAVSTRFEHLARRRMASHYLHEDSEILKYLKRLKKGLEWARGASSQPGARLAHQGNS